MIAPATAHVRAKIAPWTNSNWTARAPLPECEAELVAEDVALPLVVLLADPLPPTATPLMIGVPLPVAVPLVAVAVAEEPLLPLSVVAVETLLLMPAQRLFPSDFAASWSAVEHNFKHLLIAVRNLVLVQMHGSSIDLHVVPAMLNSAQPNTH